LDVKKRLSQQRIIRSRDPIEQGTEDRASEASR
jgi:hypothetical protein